MTDGLNVILLEEMGQGTSALEISTSPTGSLTSTMVGGLGLSVTVGLSALMGDFFSACLTKVGHPEQKGGPNGTVQQLGVLVDLRDGRTD